VNLSITHKNLDKEVDRELLESVFDESDLRYILLYMYLVRNQVFFDLKDDNVVDGFQQMYNLVDHGNLLVKDIKRLFPENVIEDMIVFKLITNVRDYTSFQDKADEFDIKINNGIYMDDKHVLFSEESLLAIIKPNFPQVTLKKITDGLKKLRTMMCQVSNLAHPLVHKYNEDYALDDDLYDIIFFLGNPYLTLRLEILIVDVEKKANEIEEELDKYLKVFYADVLKSQFMEKLEKAQKDVDSEDILEFIIKKSKNLPSKFNPTNRTELYDKWKKLFNELLQYKSDFKSINRDKESIQAYYSGKNRKISYLKFIEDVSNNQDEISKKIKDSLVKVRDRLKSIKETLDNLSIKDIKLLNLDLERELIENEEEENEE